MAKKPNLEALIKKNGEAIYDEKYIIVRVNNNGSSKIVLVSMPSQYHSEIAQAYQKISKQSFDILGGGILYIDEENKIVKTYGKSGAYGKPDRNLVEEILSKYFQGYELDVKVTDYVRG